MEINILSGSNAPETTNVLMGIYNGTDQNVDANALSSSESATAKTYCCGEM